MKGCKKKAKSKKGFLLVELLISGVILASCIAAAMYLFKIGYQNLDRAEKVYLVYSKLPLAINHIKVSSEKEGSLDLGDGVKLIWNSDLLAKGLAKGQNGSMEVPFKISLYRVNLTLKRKDDEKRYTLIVLKYEK